MVKAGVVDPAKVTRTALQNAASIAGMILTTEALIAEMPRRRRRPLGPGETWTSEPALASANEAAERPPRLFVGIPSPRGHRTGITPTVRRRAWRAAPAPTEPSGGRPPAPRG